MSNKMKKLGIFASLLMLSASFSVAAADAYVAASGQKIVTGAGVRVRDNPAVSAKEVGKLSLGTVVDINQRTQSQTKVGSNTAYWYQVTTPVKGWVFGGFTQDFDKAKVDDGVLALTRAKLGKVDKIIDEAVLPFSDAVELANFAKDAVAKTSSTEAKGELELAQWRATQVALFGVPIEDEKAKAEPYASFIKGLGEQAFYDEISAMYRVRTDVFWQLADKYKMATIGDVIAYQAANVYPGGECEGMVDCMSGRSLMMEGEYIKRFPKGKYINPALATAADTFKYIAEDWKNQPEAHADVDIAAWENLLQPVADSKEAKQLRKYIASIKVKN